MKQIYIAFFALIASTLCACSAPPSASAPAAASPVSSPVTVTAMNTAEMEKAVIEIEKQAWENFRTKNVEAMRKGAGPGSREVTASGILDSEESLKNVKDYDLKEVAFSDWKVTFPVPDTAIVTYKTQAKGSHKGKDTSGTYHSSAVWVKINGEWKSALYTEAKAELQPKK